MGQSKKGEYLVVCLDYDYLAQSPWLKYLVKSIFVEDNCSKGCIQQLSCPWRWDNFSSMSFLKVQKFLHQTFENCTIYQAVNPAQECAGESPSLNYWWHVAKLVSVPESYKLPMPLWQGSLYVSSLAPMVTLHQLLQINLLCLCNVASWEFPWCMRMFTGVKSVILTWAHLRDMAAVMLQLWWCIISALSCISNWKEIVATLT